MASTTTNLSGRLTDTYALGSSAEGRLSLSMADGGSVAVGPIEAAQKLIIRLLTKKGSDPIDRDRGTGLLALVSSGRMRNPLTAAMLAQDSLQDAVLQLAALRVDGYEAGEETASAVVDSVRFAEDTLTIAITITTMAGVSSQILLPIHLVN